jgi:LAS superfamily LD-carboxypeptidase LdcB
MLRRAIGASLACLIGSALLVGGSALAAVPHTVLPGESLWSISAANNVTMQSVAAYNGLSEDSLLLVGTTIYVPTVGEGAAPAATSTQAPAAAPGMATIPSPYGPLPLQPAAADAWNRMRAEALGVYGTDLYPGGAMSAYRTYEQQAQLYDAYLGGYGAPANPPGTSSHEWGTAIDVATPEMRSVIDQIGAKYGWTKVHGPGEWWHVDYVGG